MGFMNLVPLAAILLFAAYSLDPSGSELSRISRNQLCVTEGQINALPSGRLLADQTKMRAYLNSKTIPMVELRFMYLGSTLETSKLASGADRRQFGLKLRAQDGCNVIYVMWRIDPQPGLVVSVKQNPGEHTSADCGNKGYRNVKPIFVKPMPALTPGSSHILRADMHDDNLNVSVDQELAWEGIVGKEALSFDGPVGLRTDNVRLEFDFYGAFSTPMSFPCVRGQE